MRVSDSLVARDDLEVVLAKESDVAVETLQEAVNGRLEVLEVLVHEAKVEIECCNVRVILTGGHLEDGEGTVHMFEGTREVAARVVVESQVRVAIGCLRVVTTKNSLL